MLRFLSSMLLAFACLFASATANAQMTAQITKIVGREETILVTSPLNLEECQRGAIVELLFNNVPATASVIDIWRGEGCNATDPRTNANNQTCTWVASVPSGNETMFYVRSLAANLLMPCTTGTRQTLNLFFLAATASMTRETITSFAQISMTADADPPDAPTGIVAGDGNTAVPVSWTNPSGADLNNFWVLISPIEDPNDTTCATATLVEGEPMPAGVSIAATPAGGSQNAVIDPSAYGVAEDGYAAVAVVTRDTALNVSPVSEVACLKRVPTGGFWSLYEAEGGTASTCSVTAPGAASGPSTGALWLLAGLGAALVLRKRIGKGMLLALTLGAASLATSASAQDASSDTVITGQHNVESPERFAIEFRVGGFTPRVGNSSFRAVFGDNAMGPLLDLELDVLAYRIPYLGPIYFAGALGTASYTANAFSANGASRASEETTLSLIPISALAVLRIDVLAREFGLPFIFTGKFGADFTYWATSTGSRSDAKGLSIGMRWGAQLGFELDFFDPSAARALDEMWGLNHAFLFGELLGVIGLGDPLITNAVGWAAGLGFNF
jgi:MYXO-CTERM domain-containing protein